jgi:hypothetical protein
MEPIIIDFPGFQPHFDSVAQELRIKPGSNNALELHSLITAAVEVARPKAIYTIVSIEKQENELVRLNDTSFKSRLLCVNLDGVHRAFPYIVTCGTELDQWKNSISDPITHFFADHITGIALMTAMEGLIKHIRKHYGLSKTATMNPGSLADWPLQAQTPLFSLLGNPEKSIGVSLTDSLLMVPRQSVSGLLFETETNFVNCQLCPRENCSNRRAPYDQERSKHYMR